ncbi:ATP-binding cassette domain-containing protein, partial [Pseudoalteromonas agarivorans]|uniref:ATP-binding cassette domain-containing protein n=1 Tax=Pseudoalteromonas agarivorans TaxID=176102 RepID=UPI00311FA6C8
KLTFYQNLIPILEKRKELNKKAREDTLNKLLDEFSIQHIRDSVGMALAGGERRRVEIERALAANPKFF